MNPLKTKPVLFFLAFTFVVAYAIEFGLMLAGFKVKGIPQIFGQYIVAIVMWVPALGAFLSVKFISKEPMSVLRLKLGKIKPYILLWIEIPLLVVLIYFISWQLGFVKLDLEMKDFMKLLSSYSQDIKMPFPPIYMALILFFVSLFISPWMNTFFALGEEIGWRGFLMPRLMSLGKTKAYLILGVIWGLWHLPLIIIGFNYPDTPLLGIAMMCIFTTSIGFIMNDVVLKNESTFLAGWAHGLINSQGYGVWKLIMPQTNFIMGGIAGVVGIIVFSAYGLFVKSKQK
jgi:membrane protease YdiL (CAAX protease family)